MKLQLWVLIIKGGSRKVFILLHYTYVNLHLQPPHSSGFKTLPLATCSNVQVWKPGLPRTSGRCFPSADIQKLRLTLFGTEGTRTWRVKHIHLWQRLSVNKLHTRDTSRVLSVVPMLHFPCVKSVHGSHYKKEGVTGIQWITWEICQTFGDALASDCKSLCLRFYPQPPHTQRKSRVKKGEIGQRLGFHCWPVDACLYSSLPWHQLHNMLLLSNRLQPQKPQSLY